jgi:hypothetical protein
MSTSYECPTHRTVQDDYCAGCVADFEGRRHADDMTGDERAAEFERWCGILTIPFDKLHQRIEELVGRPVFTHELAGHAAVSLLIEEARTRDHPSWQEIKEKIPAHVEVIEVQPPAPRGAAGEGASDG